MDYKVLAGFFAFATIVSLLLAFQLKDEAYHNGYSAAEYKHQDDYDNGYADGYYYGYGEGRGSGYDSGYEDGYDEGYHNAITGDDEIVFWRESAVIVTTAGEKYHTYGCYHIKGRNYYIYNIELAKVKGYTACLDCID